MAKEDEDAAKDEDVAKPANDEATAMPVGPDGPDDDASFCNQKIFMDVFGKPFFDDDLPTDLNAAAAAPPKRLSQPGGRQKLPRLPPPPKRLSQLGGGVAAADPQTAVSAGGKAEAAPTPQTAVSAGGGVAVAAPQTAASAGGKAEAAASSLDLEEDDIPVLLAKEMVKLLLHREVEELRENVQKSPRVPHH